MNDLIEQVESLPPDTAKDLVHAILADCPDTRDYIRSYLEGVNA